MAENTKRVLIDSAAFLVVVSIGALVFDNLFMGIFTGLLVGGGTDVAQRKRAK